MADIVLGDLTHTVTSKPKEVCKMTFTMDSTVLKTASFKFTIVARSVVPNTCQNSLSYF